MGQYLFWVELTFLLSALPMAVFRLISLAPCLVPRISSYLKLGPDFLMKIFKPSSLNSPLPMVSQVCYRRFNCLHPLHL